MYIVGLHYFFGDLTECTFHKNNHDNHGLDNDHDVKMMIMKTTMTMILSTMMLLMMAVIMITIITCKPIG